MATIFYGIAGEGRGHATRAMSLIEDLRERHRVVVYTSGHALEFLAPLYEGTDVSIRTLPSVEFHYTKSRRVSYVRTFVGNVPYLAHLKGLARDLARAMEHEKVDLVLTDFEPVLPRAADAACIPWLSVDHQHFLTTSDLRDLPVELQLWARFCEPFVHSWYQGWDGMLTSSFYRPPLRPGCEDVVQAGVILRRSVVEATPEDGEHIVAYIRRHHSQEMLEALRGCGLPVRVYGLGERPSEKGLRFCAIHSERFIEDLASSRALVTTAGNQLVGESLYLGKPVLALPEPGNQEQRINAHFVRSMDVGMACEMDAVTGGTIRAFLDRLSHYESRIDRDFLYGNPTAIGFIEGHLEGQTGARAIPRRELASVTDLFARLAS